jgi:RNA polymerase sigma-70 factor, ECF subfamily
MEASPRHTLVLQALSGHEQAVGTLVDLLTPVIQNRVAQVLVAFHPPGDEGHVPHQVEDLTQDVFLALFDDDARVLRSWRSEEGLSLENFVGLVARRRAISCLRSGKRNPWREDPTLTEEHEEEPAADPGPEARAASKQELRFLLRRMQAELSPQGWNLFDLLLVQRLPVEEVERRTRMSRDAIYAWRSRLRKLARRLLREAVSESR